MLFKQILGPQIWLREGKVCSVDRLSSCYEYWIQSSVDTRIQLGICGWVYREFFFIIDTCALATSFGFPHSLCGRSGCSVKICYLEQMVSYPKSTSTQLLQICKFNHAILLFPHFVSLEAMKAILLAHSTSLFPWSPGNEKPFYQYHCVACLEWLFTPVLAHQWLHARFLKMSPCLVNPYQKLSFEFQRKAYS